MEMNRPGFNFCALVAVCRRLEKSKFHQVLAASAFFVLLSCLPARAEGATLPGEVTTPYPTIINLAVEWFIKGDDNLNCVVNVEYRILGEKKWHQGMPLARIPAGKNRTSGTTFLWENKLSGSIFDLKPDTEYEIRLSLSDPDGGEAVKTVYAKTRAVPKAALNGVEKKVDPITFSQAVAQAKAGDILVLAPGYYDDFTASCSGEPGCPIVIRSDGSHEVLNSTFDRINLNYCKHLILEGITVNGSIDINYAEEVAIRRCTVNAKYGIIAKGSPGARNCYIADNIVTYSMPWIEMGMGSIIVHGGAANVGEGIQLTGPGNVICYNRVKGYRDCISAMEGHLSYEQKCIDIYNNDINVGTDDAIEADFCVHNCRIMRNRIINCFIGLSSQPSLGGPIYYIRNVMYNIVHSPFKVTRHSVGSVFLHNTCVKVGDGFRVPHGQNSYFRTSFRNNICIGGPQGGKYGNYSSGTGLAVSIPGYNSTCEFDYNGVGAYKTQFEGRIADKIFKDIEGLRRLTGGNHSVRVDMSIFMTAVEFPCFVYPEREPADLRLREGSAAVDAGAYIPNVNDNYTGFVPDLGAYELGEKVPHYGPRPPEVDEEAIWIENHR